MRRTLEFERRASHLKRIKKIKELGNYVYVLPVILGLLFFTFIPMAVSLVYSFKEIDLTDANNPIGNWTFKNWQMIYDDWADIWSCLKVTFRYAIFTIVSSMIGSYVLALLLNKKIKGSKVLRVILYLPALIPAVAGVYLSKQMTSSSATGGYLNMILKFFGIPDFSFYDRAETVFPTIMFFSISSWGSQTMMWLAQMQNIPNELYEAAELDGANRWHRLIHITIPMSTSMIFYQSVVGIIAALQVFSGFFPLINAYNKSELWFFVVKIYVTAGFGAELATAAPQLGYACALTWLLAAIIGVITLSIFKTSKWVYYGEER